MPVTDLTAPGLSLGSADPSPPGNSTDTTFPGAGDSGLPWWLSLLGRMNPYARGAITAGGVLQPTSTAPPSQDELPQRFWPGPSQGSPTAPGGRPAAPLPQLPDWGLPWSGTPQPADAQAPGPIDPSIIARQKVAPAQSGPIDPSIIARQKAAQQPGPIDPSIIARQKAAPAYQQPGPIDPSIIARAKMARKVATAAPSPMFVPIIAPNSDPFARNRPQMSALNLSRIFGGS